MRVVLASQSPRRRELLAAAGLDLVVRPADVDEAPWADELPEQTVLRLARAKAAVCLTPDAIVVAADTEVVLHGAVLGKPAGAAAAISMLTRMAGLEHEVITGFCVRAGAHERTGIVRTRVGFRPLSAEEIGRYVATGEPFDKAGGYGIQG
jgi:septum formation protein